MNAHVWGQVRLVHSGIKQAIQQALRKMYRALLSWISGNTASKVTCAPKATADSEHFEHGHRKYHVVSPSLLGFQLTEPRGSRYLTSKELGLKDHDYCGFWCLSPE